MSVLLDPVIYVVVVGFAMVGIAMLVYRLPKLKVGIPAGFGAGLVGLVIGLGAAILGLQVLGYEAPDQRARQVADNAAGSPAPSGVGMTSAGGMGPMGMSMGMAGGGMGGPGGMGPAGAAGGASPRRSLSTLVAKLELLTAGLRIDLTPDQQRTIADTLAKLDEATELTDADAQKRIDDIQNLLTKDQAAVLGSIELRSRGGLSSAPGPVQTGATGRGQSTATPSSENPFKQPENAKRLQRLRDRLGNK
jgi:hypothetical protein